MFVLEEKESESERDRENKRKLPPQHKFTMMLGDKGGPLQLSGPLNGQPSTCGHLGGYGEGGK